ncbi:UNVERIFIED_ORG: AraC-like DNA-binding protein [Pseudomonas lini]
MHTLPPNHTESHSSPSTVLASVITGFEAFVESQGANADTILARAGLKRGLALKPSSAIPLRGYCRALNEAVTATKNDNLGLWFGEQFMPCYSGLLGYLALSAPTLKSALQGLLDRFPIHQQASYLRLNMCNDLYYLEYQVWDTTVIDRRQDAELSLCKFLNIIRRAMGKQWAPLEVHFRHAKPAAWQEHRWVFGTDVKFGQSRNALVFRGDILAQPMPNADPTLQGVITQALDGLSSSRSPTTSLAQQVKMHITEMFHDGSPHLEDIVRRMSIPSWTLHRRLSRENVSFKTLLEEVRKEMVPVLMRQQPMTISELATRLGYSEVSAFSRAFQRWHGVSPKHWHEVQPVST